MRTGSINAAATALIMLAAQGVATEAAELKVRTGNLMSEALRELGPRFERATGHKLVIQYGPTGVTKRMIEKGETLDLAIIAPVALDDLIKQGK